MNVPSRKLYQYDLKRRDTVLIVKGGRTSVHTLFPDLSTPYAR